MDYGEWGNRETAPQPVSASRHESHVRSEAAVCARGVHRGKTIWHGSSWKAHPCCQRMWQSMVTQSPDWLARAEHPSTAKVERPPPEDAGYPMLPGQLEGHPWSC